MKLIVVSQGLDKLESDQVVELLRSNIDPHIEYRLIYPKSGTSYKIEEIKEFNTMVGRRPVDHDKVPAYVFMHSHLLTPICQNAMLKTLEESIYSIILSVRNSGSLLPTIRSRCQIVYFKNENIEESAIQFGAVTFESIPSLAKEERVLVKARLEGMLKETDPEEYKAVIAIQEAIDKLEANCKIDSVLYELVWKVKSIE